jgi:hypothetical protein
MRGHIIKRYKDSYTIVVNVGTDPATGKRKQQWYSVKGTKKDAEKKLAELLHQLDTGTFIRPVKITVAEFLERWLKDYVRPNLPPRQLNVHVYRSLTYRSALGNVPRHSSSLNSCRDTMRKNWQAAGATAKAL